MHLLRFTWFALPVLFGSWGGHAWGQAQLRSPDHVTQMTRREALPASARAEHDDNQAAARYWYESRNPKNLPAMEAALARVLPTALRQSAWVTEVPSWEEAHRVQAYHDAGAILLARCYTLLYYGREAEAKESIRLIHEKFPHALMLMLDRQTTLVRRSLRYHMHACALYRAIRERKMYDFEFPPELDEHDAWAQEQAVEDMAMLRLREGDFDGLEHLASQARVRELKTPDGEWVSDGVFSGLHPPRGESWAKAAWDEMEGRLEEWRAKKPTSVDARIARVIFTLHRFKADVPGSPSVVREKLREVRREVNEIGLAAPQMPLLDLIISMAMKESLEQTAAIYQKAQAKFPGYTPVHNFMILCLALQQGGERHCAAMMKELASREDTAEQPVLFFTTLPERAARSVMKDLPLKELRQSMQALLESASGSLHMRNKIGLLAVYAGQDDIGMEAMGPVGDRWDRDLWRGHEYDATRLIKRRAMTAAASIKTGEL